jgi:hypothetical protein
VLAAFTLTLVFSVSNNSLSLEIRVQKPSMSRLLQVISPLQLVRPHILYHTGCSYLFPNYCFNKRSLLEAPTMVWGMTPVELSTFQSLVPTVQFSDPNTNVSLDNFLCNLNSDFLTDYSNFPKYKLSNGGFTFLGASCSSWWVSMTR